MAKAKEFINNIINSVWFVVIIALFLLGKTFFFYYNTIAISEPLELITIFGTISFVTIIVCFLSSLSNKTRVITTIIVDFFLSLLLFGDHAYYIFSNSVLSVAQISNLQYGDEIISTLPMILNIKQIFYFLEFIILIVLKLGGLLEIKKAPKRNKKEWIKTGIVASIGVLLFAIIGVNYVEKGRQKSYNKDLQIREATIFGYHVYDIENLIVAKKHTKYKNFSEMEKDYNSLKEHYEKDYGHTEYLYKGVSSGKNVIIVQLESVQEFVTHKQINGREITPNLNNFLNENIEFTNMHMQSYSTTADSEHSTITSLYPMENGMSFSKYYTNTYDDIFKIFKQKNYHTSYMHGNYQYFWNRGNVYGRLDLSELVLREQFEDWSETINGDLSDEIVYKQAVQKWKQYENPFFSYIVAASSHTPFTLDGLQDRSKISIDVGKYKNTYFGDFLEAMNYADYAFGILLQELKNEGLYDDTTILVFGDHNGLNMYNEELGDFLSYIDNNLNDIDLKLNYTRIACGLKLPNSTNATLTIEKPINKLDIKPTFAYLCDLEDKFSLGTNMFASKNFVSLNNGRIITDQYYYDEEWYNIETGEPIQEEREELYSYYQDMQKELDISNSISINNLLKRKLKGVRLKNNYNFGYVKCYLKRGYIHHVCALAF